MSAENKIRWTGRGMSNFDHTVDEGMEDDLRAGMRGTHAAWNFHGEVWYDPDEQVFREEIRQYQAVQGTRSAATLEELMQVVNDEFGRG